MILNVFSEMQHWFGKIQNRVGEGAIVAVSSSTKMGLLNIMVQWMDEKANPTCKPALMKFSLLDLKKLGQDGVVDFVVEEAKKWRSEQKAIGAKA